LKACQYGSVLQAAMMLPRCEEVNPDLPKPGQQMGLSALISRLACFAYFPFQEAHDAGIGHGRHVEAHIG